MALDATLLTTPIAFIFGFVFGVLVVSIFAIDAYDRGARDTERAMLRSRDPRP